MRQDDYPLGCAIRLALATSHRHLALTHGLATRYPREVAPFAAIGKNTTGAFDDLQCLVAPGEAVYLMGEAPLQTSGFRMDGTVYCLQMLFPDGREIPPTSGGAQIEPLDCSQSAEMVDLIDVAYPGYFRAGTCRMGAYFGIRAAGRLAAMGGERLILESSGRQWGEISGLCTHPEHTGKGFGTALLLHILRQQREAGKRSWLHVVDTNLRAIDLYRYLGFQTIRRIELHRITRAE